MTNPTEEAAMHDLAESSGIPEEQRPDDMPSVEMDGDVLPDQTDGSESASGGPLQAAKEKLLGNQ